MSEMCVSHAQVVGWAIEALKRGGYKGLDNPMHPEDWAAALVPAIEAVALGYGKGYRRGLADGRA